MSSSFRIGVLVAIGVAIGLHAHAFPRRSGLRVERDIYQASGCKYVLFSHPQKFGESLLALGVLERVALPSGKTWTETGGGAVLKARFRMEFPFFPLAGSEKECDLDSMYKVFGPKRVRRGRTVQVKTPAGGSAWIRIAAPDTPKGYLFSREIALPEFALLGERTLEFPLTAEERDALKAAIDQGLKSYFEFSVQSAARAREGLTSLKGKDVAARIRKSLPMRALKSIKETGAGTLVPLLKKALRDLNENEGVEFDSSIEPRLLATLLHNETPEPKSLSRMLDSLERLDQLSLPTYARGAREETLDTWFGLPLRKLSDPEDGEQLSMR
jgi:hypothetical protein